MWKKAGCEKWTEFLEIHRKYHANHAYSMKTLTFFAAVVAAAAVAVGAVVAVVVVVVVVVVSMHSMHNGAFRATIYSPSCFALVSHSNAIIVSIAICQYDNMHLK